MEADQKIRDVLIRFEEVIENHSNNLTQLENIIAINEPDFERCSRVVKRIRRTRKEILSGLKTIVEYFPTLTDEKVREETIGIVSYLHMIGFSDEVELLKDIESMLNRIGTSLNIDEDLKELEQLIAMTSKLSF